MVWSVEYSRTARKSLEKLDAQVRRRIYALIDARVALLENPRDAGKALKGPLSTLWVYRAGDYRIICDIQDNTLVILVVTIGHRRDVYQ